MVQNTDVVVMTESDAYYKGGFYRPMCEQGTLG